MTQQFDSQTHAVNVLLQGVQVAKKRGAYSLEEASVLSSAVTFLTAPASDSTPQVEDDSEKQTSITHSPQAKKNKK